MNDEFERRIQAAAIAGWYVVIVASIFLTGAWIAYLVAIPAQPAWMISMWGPNLSWDDVQFIWLWAIVIFKLGIWLTAMIALWLTLWARELRKAKPR